MDVVGALKKGYHSLRSPRGLLDDFQQEEEELDQRPYGSKRRNEAFVPSEGLSTDEADQLIKIHGLNEIADRSVPSWVIFVRQLYAPMPMLIWLAIILLLAIPNFLDVIVLLVIQLVNATIGWYETTKAGDAVAALKASLKPIAVVKRDGKFRQIEASQLVPGDLVLLASGAAVPADCVVNSGQIDVDTSALTGESLAVNKEGGEDVLMGSTVVRGEVEATVAFTGFHTFFGRTAKLVRSVDELGSIQKLIFKITAGLVVISMILCSIALFVLAANRNAPFKEALRFVVVLMVASTPLAIEIVTTCTLAAGSHTLAKMDAIVTRLVAIEELAGMNVLCSDKTGTLTLNKMVIQEECPTFLAGETRASVLEAAALATKWKEPAKDALDTMILSIADLHALDRFEQLHYLPFDPSVKRTESTLRLISDGHVFKTTKGAPHIILDLCDNKERIQKVVNDRVNHLGLRGIRCLAVARTDEHEQWRFLGMLTFKDPPRPDTKEMIHKAMEYGVAVKMITGDQVVIALETARSLGLGTAIRGVQGLPSLDEDGAVPKDLGKKYGKLIMSADGFAQVYPEHKFLIVEALRQEGYRVGMTGDGVNDAPALKRSDVGIAVSGSTDAARAAADIVLTSPGLSVVVEAIVVSRCIFQRVKSFINYRIAATLQLLCFFFLAVLKFPPSKYQPPERVDDPRVADYRSLLPEGDEPWPDFFQLPVILLMLITLLNDGTLISIGYDNVTPSHRPEKWNLPVLFVTSSSLAAMACGSSLYLLHAALDSFRKNSLFDKLGLPPVEYGKIVTMIYLKVSLSDFLTLFSSRTEGWFFSLVPGKLLLFGAGFSLLISSLLASLFPETEIEHVAVRGLVRGSTHNLWPIWVWMYCIVWWFLQDLLKVIIFKFIYTFNLFNARKEKEMGLASASRGVGTADAYGNYGWQDGADLVTVRYPVRDEGLGEVKEEEEEEQDVSRKEKEIELTEGGLGREIGARLEARGPKLMVSVSYSRQGNKSIAEQIRKSVERAGKGESSSSSSSPHSPVAPRSPRPSRFGS